MVGFRLHWCSVPPAGVLPCKNPDRLNPGDAYNSEMLRHSLRREGPTGLEFRCEGRLARRLAVGDLAVGDLAVGDLAVGEW